MDGSQMANAEVSNACEQRKIQHSESRIYTNEVVWSTLDTAHKVPRSGNQFTLAADLFERWRFGVGADVIPRNRQTTRVSRGVKWLLGFHVN
jgi:hypothetical protein